MRSLTAVCELGKSELGDRRQKLMAASGTKRQLDQDPLRHSFIRSGLCNFVPRGIPSMTMAVGFEGGTPQGKMFQVWLEDRSHARCNDTNQPFDLAPAAPFGKVGDDLTVAVATDPVAPAWKPDGLIRHFAEPAMASRHRRNRDTAAGAVIRLRDSHNCSDWGT